jgi:uncharacterized protein
MNTLRVKLCSSITDRTIGLIGKNKSEPLMFLTRFGIHTFGMKFPLDIIVLDDNNVVVKLQEDLKPNHVFFWSLKFKKVIELPVGYIKTKKIKGGSKISLEMIK